MVATARPRSTPASTPRRAAQAAIPAMARPIAIRSQLMNAARMTRGGQRDAQRGPPAGPAREVGGGQHADQREQGEQDDSEVEELPAPVKRVADRVDQPGHQLHGPADEHRVLHRVIDVGHLARRQSLPEVQRVDVGVTVRLELRQVPVPRARPARPLVGQRQPGAEQHGRDQGRGRPGEQGEPRRPGPRPSLRLSPGGLLAVWFLAGRARVSVCHPRSVIGYRVPVIVPPPGSRLPDRRLLPAERGRGVGECGGGKRVARRRGRYGVVVLTVEAVPGEVEALAGGCSASGSA